MGRYKSSSAFGLIVAVDVHVSVPLSEVVQGLGRLGFSTQRILPVFSCRSISHHDHYAGSNDFGEFLVPSLQASLNWNRKTLHSGELPLLFGGAFGEVDRSISVGSLVFFN